MSNESHFECFVVESYCYRDMDNRDACKDNSYLVTAGNLNDLYEKLGEAKARETPQEDRGDEYTDVDFGRIKEIIVVSETDVDDGILKKTSACQKQEQQRRNAVLKKQLALTAQAAEKEAREIAELRRLQAKYPTTERSAS
jgi:predicted GNAT family N-acyltransferase